MYLRAIRDYFNDLLAGDPVALSITGAIALFAVVMLTLWFASFKKKQREEQLRELKKKQLQDDVDKTFKRMKGR